MKLTIEFSRDEWHALKAKATEEGRGSRSQIAVLIRDLLQLYGQKGWEALAGESAPPPEPDEEEQDA
jgi:hypothetical protein